MKKNIHYEYDNISLWIQLYISSQNIADLINEIQVHKVNRLSELPEITLQFAQKYFFIQIHGQFAEIQTWKEHVWPIVGYTTSNVSMLQRI